MPPKVAITETITATMGMTVARQLCRKMKTTRMTSTMASSRVHHLVDRGLHELGGVQGDGVIDASRKALLQFFQRLRTCLETARALAPAC